MRVYVVWLIPINTHREGKEGETVRSQHIKRAKQIDKKDDRQGDKAMLISRPIVLTKRR